MLPEGRLTPGLLASGLGRIGRPHEGLQVVEEGLVSVAKTGLQLDIPILHHTKGELLLLVQRPSNEQAELCFRTAIEIARRLSARSMELRATTSLARLVAKQGRRANASLMLGDIYSRFTEGVDTVDLKAAKALLDQLDG